MTALSSCLSAARIFGDRQSGKAAKLADAREVLA